MCYDNGTGVAKDPAEAARWYRLAADQGHAAAQRALGRHAVALVLVSCVCVCVCVCVFGAASGVVTYIYFWWYGQVESFNTHTHKHTHSVFPRERLPRER